MPLGCNAPQKNALHWGGSIAEIYRNSPFHRFYAIRIPRAIPANEL